MCYAPGLCAVGRLRGMVVFGRFLSLEVGRRVVS
jgi:hypothetical protein